MVKNKNTYKDESFDKYKNLYNDLIKNLKRAVDTINSSDYSKKSLGRFKDTIEKLLYNIEDN